METPQSSHHQTDGTSADVFSEIQHLVQRLAELERDLHQLVRGQIDAVIDPDSGHIILLRQAQEALHSNERQLRALFESALDAILIADDEGRYIDANPAASELFGLSRESLIGRTVRDFAAPMSISTRCGTTFNNNLRWNAAYFACIDRMVRSARPNTPPLPISCQVVTFPSCAM
ncbi:MAG: PAS domain S-box protein [Caldilineaceae bacterium]